MGLFGLPCEALAAVHKSVSETWWPIIKATNIEPE
jgi:hypothetical protein